MATRSLSILNAEGLVLSARLDLPDGRDPVAYAVFAHCFSCTKNLNMVRHISRALTAEGIAVLRFDFTGHGESEGTMERAGLASNVSDLQAVAAYLAANFESPKLLVGHSLGGAAAIAVANQIESVRAVATIGAPARLDSLLTNLEQNPDREAAGKVHVRIGSQEFWLAEEVIEAFRTGSVLEEVASLKAALLVMHAPEDCVVDVSHGDLLFGAASYPKSYVSLDGTGHMMLDRRVARYAGRVLASWATRFVGGDGGRESGEGGIEEKFAGDGVVTVRTERGFETAIVANGFSLRADEPASLGGTETGPTPYDYLCASLGACTSMTLRMYADRKQWPLESIDVRVTHRKVRAVERDPQADEKARLDHFQRRISLEGVLSEDQRVRLLEIADRCPVHRTLEGQAWISTALEEMKEEAVETV